MIKQIFCNKNGQLHIVTVLIGSLVFTLLGFIPGMGLPGAVMLVVGDFFLRWTVGLAGYPSMFDLTGSNIWTPILLIHITIFPFLVVAYLLAFRWYVPKQKIHRWGVWLLCFLVWSIGVTVLFTQLLEV